MSYVNEANALRAFRFSPLLVECGPHTVTTCTIHHGRAIKTTIILQHEQKTPKHTTSTNTGTSSKILGQFSPPQFEEIDTLNIFQINYKLV